MNEKMQNNKKILFFIHFLTCLNTALKIEKLREMVEKQENFTAQEKKIIQNF